MGEGHQAAPGQVKQLLTIDYPDTQTVELSALSRQCLDRRISDLDTLNTELAAWLHAINTEQRQVRWQFTTTDTRTKLRHLYPKN